MYFHVFKSHFHFMRSAKAKRSGEQSEFWDQSLYPGSFALRVSGWGSFW